MPQGTANPAGRLLTHTDVTHQRKETPKVLSSHENHPPTLTRLQPPCRLRVKPRRAPD